MRGSYISQFIFSTPWAILPDKFAEILAVAERHAAGLEISAAELAEIKAMARPATPARGAVAVVPVLGTIIPRGDAIAESSGATSTTRLAALFQQALADPGVSAIVLDVNSPGGSAAGVDELAQLIYQSRGVKPIVAVANHLAASAAYWIASAADELVVSPSAQVGSIGVFAAHQDNSVALEKAGVRVTLVSAGKYKTEGNPFEPLSAEAQAYAQEQVNSMYGLFVQAVARGRGVSAADVQGGFGQGRLVGAQQAVALGMADRVDTMDGTLARLARGGPAGGLAASLGESMSADMTAGPIAPHKSPGIAPRDAAWDGPAEVAAAEVGELPKMCAWVDEGVKPPTKGAYKLPHHRHGDHFLVAAGLHGCAGRLNQTDVPAGDMAGIRRHLEGHYHELGDKAPWEASGDTELRRRRLRLAGKDTPAP